MIASRLSSLKNPLFVEAIRHYDLKNPLFVEAIRHYDLS